MFGPTERIYSFVDSLLQPITIKQDTTDFLDLIENTQIPENVVLATLDVSSLYTNIPQEQGIDVVFRYHEDHYEQKLPIPTSDLRELMWLIFKENYFKFNEKQFVQTHGVAMGTKTTVTFSAISWRTLKNDCQQLVHLNHSSGRDLLLTYSLCGTFQCRKFLFL